MLDQNRFHPNMVHRLIMQFLTIRYNDSSIMPLHNEANFKFICSFVELLHKKGEHQLIRDIFSTRS